MLEVPDEMVDAYIVAALWSSIDDEDNPLDDNFGPENIHPDTLAKMREDCQAFYDEVDNIPDYQGSGDYSDAERFGHDFWLSRNGHGAGFFDRGLGDIGRKLQDAARVWGEYNLYVGDDGMIYGA